ncbi:MAG: MlaE family ABC transporter permease [bacterium]
MIFFDKIGNFLIKTQKNTFKYIKFVFECFAYMFIPPYRFNQIAEHVEKIGIQSVIIVSLSTFTTGMILSLQLINIMRLFGAETFAGAGVAISMSRELAPVITAIVLIAKNGSAMTAEIGSMKVTEQIDAMETMAVNPVRYLVIPRIFASLAVFPALTALANVVGILGGFIVAKTSSMINNAAFLHTMYFWVDPDDIWTGLVKAFFFGFIVSTICCFHGLKTKGGAKGVGSATTTAVVISTVTILIADYIMTYIFINFFNL